MMPADNDIDHILESWDGALRRFQANIYPTFQRYGFTLPEAFLAFKLNQTQNSIEDLQPEPVDEDEPWKPRKDRN